jgi:hypothetical protein
MAEIRKDLLENLGMTAINLQLWCLGAERLVPALRSSAKRFEEETFVEIDGKEIASHYEVFSSVLETALGILSPALVDLHLARSEKRIPSKELLAKILLTLSVVNKSSRAMPSQGNVWRWKPDYHQVRRANKPLEDVDDIGQWVDGLVSNIMPLYEVSV